MTDGGNDFTDAVSLRSYREAASQTSSDKRLSSLNFYGVQPQFRQGIQFTFMSAGSKLQILNQEQVLGEG